MSFVHQTAMIEHDTAIGDNTRIWALVQVRPGAVVGNESTFGRNSFIDVGVSVGSRVKVQNNASLFEGVTIEDGVFVGPHVIFANDRVPRAVNPDGTLKSAADWEVSRTTVRYGASIGAGAVILPGLEIGRWAMVGSGAVVTHDVPDHGLVVGNPGRLVGYVAASGTRCESLDEAIDRSEREAATPG